MLTERLIQCPYTTNGGEIMGMEYDDAFRQMERLMGVGPSDSDPMTYGQLKEVLRVVKGIHNWCVEQGMPTLLELDPHSEEPPVASGD
jgi:hypothetical protein